MTRRVFSYPRLVLLALTVAAVVLRCILATSVPLFSVEAYYWLWNRHLAFGYFDHPPMVAWMARLFFGWINGSDLAARASAIAIGGASIAALYALVLAMFADRRLALIAAAVYTITPIFDLNGVILQPDNSLVLFMILTWLFFWCAANGGSIATWIMAGVFAGLALLSKFHAWILLPPLWLFLFLSRPHRHLLRTSCPWVAAFVAILLLLPNLWWNAQHDWLNYAFQWRRSSIPRASFRLENLLVYALAPMLTLSPLLFLAVVRGTWTTLRAPAPMRSPQQLFLICAGLPLPVFLGLLSPFITINPHWPAAGLLALLLLAISLAYQNQLISSNYWRAAFSLSVAMTVFIHLAPYAITAAPDPHEGEKKDSVFSLARIRREVLDWPRIGARISERLHVEPGDRVLMAQDWHRAALLAFYAKEPYNTFTLDTIDAHNFELWRRERGGLAGANALCVILKEKPQYKHASLEFKYDKYHRYLDPLFHAVKELPSVVCYANGAIEDYYGIDISRPRIAEFMLFRCDGFIRPRNGELIGERV